MYKRVCNSVTQDSLIFLRYMHRDHSSRTWYCDSTITCTVLWYAPYNVHLSCVDLKYSPVNKNNKRRYTIAATYYTHLMYSDIIIVSHVDVDLKLPITCKVYLLCVFNP